MATHTVRKQIYISQRQEQLLKRLSQSLGISEAEFIRQAIDRQAANAAPALPGSHEESWQELVTFMHSLRERADQFSEPYHWNREELYEERLSRFNVRESPHSGDASSDETPT